MKKFCTAVFILMLFVSPGSAGAKIADDDYKAVILTYYRINEEAYPGSNLHFEQFQEQIEAIKAENLNVIPVTDIVSALKKGQRLPPKTLGITFQGGFKSILPQAVPLLLKEELPFTVFFAADMADQKNAQYLSWKDLEHLKKNKNATLGLMPANYTSIANLGFSENKASLNKALTKYRDHIKEEPKLFAYPFGEFDETYQTYIKSQGFNAAFGLQSGAAHPGSDLYNLPRFSMTENYGDLERFKVITNTLPLPAVEIEPKTSLAPLPFAGIGFTIPEQYTALIPDIRCYASGQGQVPLEILGTRRIEIRPTLIAGEKLRINCTTTIPPEKPDGKIQYRWLGFFLSGKQQ